MASPSSSPIDSLPDALLVTILSLLPTRCAARTSVLCRRFRHLWEASPSLELVSNQEGDPFKELPNFIAMADRALLQRRHPLCRMRLGVYKKSKEEDPIQMAAYVPSLLIKAHSLGLRHLEVCATHLLPTVLPTILNGSVGGSLQSLSVRTHSPFCLEDSLFLDSIPFTLTRLKTLFLGRIDVDSESPATNLNRLLSHLCSLQHLSLSFSMSMSNHPICISSKTVRKLELTLCRGSPTIKFLGLSMPSLEFLHLDSDISAFVQTLPPIHGDIPLLRKAVLTHGNVYGENGAASLLTSISHVEELSLDIRESFMKKDPYTVLLEPGKNALNFPNLKHLDVTLCFHKHNLPAVVAMLRHSPALESVKLVHKDMTPHELRCGPKKKKEDWASKLPGNCLYAYFGNLHLEENAKEYAKWLNEICCD